MDPTKELVLMELVENISAFQRADHERILRIESMLVFQLERDKMEVSAKPNVDEARQLAVMKLPAWKELKRATNAYEVWKEGFVRKMELNQQGGTTDGKA